MNAPSSDHPARAAAPSISQEGPAAVEIRSVSKVFGSVVALDKVSLSIRRGEFFSLLGPSGCGKTTLLRIIGGFEDLSSGMVLIDGNDCGFTPPYARSTNMIFQHLALFPHMNVFENLAFGLRRKRCRRRHASSSASLPRSRWCGSKATSGA